MLITLLSLLKAQLKTLLKSVILSRRLKVPGLTPACAMATHRVLLNYHTAALNRPIIQHIIISSGMLEINLLP